MKSRGLLNVNQLDKLIPLSYAGTPTEDVDCEAARKFLTSIQGECRTSGIWKDSLSISEWLACVAGAKWEGELEIHGHKFRHISFTTCAMCVLLRY